MGAQLQIEMPYHDGKGRVLLVIGAREGPKLRVLVAELTRHAGNVQAAKIEGDDIEGWQQASRHVLSDPSTWACFYEADTWRDQHG
jgi:hypothetical protein